MFVWIIFYLFDKSTKPKGKLVEYFAFCDQEYQSVPKHLSVRWLSIECCLVQILKKVSKFKVIFCKWRFER